MPRASKQAMDGADGCAGLLASRQVARI